MRTETCIKAIACDGTEFYGNDADKECIEYENKCKSDLETKMFGKITIVQKDLYIEHIGYMKFIYFLITAENDDELNEAWELFMSWMEYNNFKLTNAYVGMDPDYKALNIWSVFMSSDGGHYYDYIGPAIKIYNVVQDQINWLTDLENMILNNDPKIRGRRVYKLPDRR